MSDLPLFAAVLANSERRLKAIREHLARSVGQKARYHKGKLREAVRAARTTLEGGE